MKRLLFTILLALAAASAQAGDPRYDAYLRLALPATADTLFGALDRQDALAERTASSRLPMASGFNLPPPAQRLQATFYFEHERTVRVGVQRDALERLDALPVRLPFARRSIYSLDFEQRYGAATIVASAGGLRESGTTTGLQGNLLTPSLSTRTTFVALSGAWALRPRLSLVGMASAARSTASGLEGLIVNDEPVTTVAYSAGLSARDLLAGGDRFGLTLSAPARATHGAPAFAGAAMLRDDGSMAYSLRSFNLGASAAERDLELSYSRSAGKGARFSAALMVRNNPGLGATRDYMAGVRYMKNF